jgi:hypothetical protein
MKAIAAAPQSRICRRENIIPSSYRLLINPPWVNYAGTVRKVTSITEL